MTKKTYERLNSVAGHYMKIVGLLEKAYREEDNSMEITHLGAPGHQVTLTKILGDMLHSAHNELEWTTCKIRCIERDVLGLKQ